MMMRLAGTHDVLRVKFQLQAFLAEAGEQGATLVHGGCALPLARGTETWAAVGARAHKTPTGVVARAVNSVFCN